MNNAAIEDYELVQRCCACDYPSKEDFISKYTRLVYHVFLKYCAGQPEEDREDFAQSAWLHLFSDNGRRLRMYRPEARFSTWFSTVLTRLCMDLNRHETKPMPIDLPAESDHFDRAEMRILIKQLSHVLSPEEKKLLALYLEEVPTQKIIEETGIKSAAEVHKKIFNAKEKLRREAAVKGVIPND